MMETAPEPGPYQVFLPTSHSSDLANRWRSAKWLCKQNRHRCKSKRWLNTEAVVVGLRWVLSSFGRGWGGNNQLLVLECLWKGRPGVSLPLSHRAPAWELPQPIPAFPDAWLLSRTQFLAPYQRTEGELGSVSSSDCFTLSRTAS